jgi:hypothetical protein
LRDKGWDHADDAKQSLQGEERQSACGSSSITQCYKNCWNYITEEIAQRENISTTRILKVTTQTTKCRPSSITPSSQGDHHHHTFFMTNKVDHKESARPSSITFFFFIITNHSDDELCHDSFSLPKLPNAGLLTTKLMKK